MNKDRNNHSSALIILAACLILVGSGQAVTFHKNDVHLSNLHRMDDDLFAMTSTVVIDGFIDGDLMSLASDVTHNGEITGSANVWAYHYLQNGKVGGAVRVGGYSVAIDGYVGRSIMAFGKEVRLGSHAMVRRDLMMRGENVIVSGTVMGSADLGGERVEVTGQIDGDLIIEAKNIRIIPPAVIKGDLICNSDAIMEIDSLGGVTILGKVSRRVDEAKPDGEEESTLARDIILTISKTAAAFLFGVILIHLFGKYARQSYEQLKSRPAVATAAGFLAMLVCLLSTVVLLLSVLLLMVGYAMVSGDNAVVGSLLSIFSIIMIPVTSLVSVTGAVLFYTGKITLAMLLGYHIVALAKKDPVVLSKTQLLVGLAVLTAFVSLPYVGTVLYILASVIGAGAIVLGVRRGSSHGPQADSSA